MKYKLSDKLIEWMAQYRKLIDNGEVDEEVLLWIGAFRFSGDSVESLRTTFRHGYCYYFANMLLTTFQRGKIIVAAPSDHVIWIDTNETGYDIDGPYNEITVPIPFDKLGDASVNYMHIPGKHVEFTPQQFLLLMRSYAYNEDHYAEAMHRYKNSNRCIKQVKEIMMHHNYPAGDRVVHDIIALTPDEAFEDYSTLEKYVLDLIHTKFS